MFRVLAVGIALLAAVIALGLVVVGVYELTRPDSPLVRIADSRALIPGRFSAPPRL